MDDRISSAASVLEPLAETEPASSRNRRAPRKARGAFRRLDGHILFDTVVRQSEGVYAMLLLGGPSADASECARRQIRRVLDQAHVTDPKELLLAVNEELLGLNQRLDREAESKPKRFRAQLTVLVRRSGGFSAAYSGSDRIGVIRRGGILLPALPPRERTMRGETICEYLGTSPPPVSTGVVDTEGGDLLFIAGPTIASLDSEGSVEVIQDAARGKGLQELTDRIGAIITVPVPGRLPAPEVGRSNGLSWAALSSVGMRARNEDGFLVDGETLTFVQADGLGGHDGGAVASRIAVETVGEVFGDDAPAVPPRETAGRACDLAGRRVAQEIPGGGTTLDVVHIRDRKAVVNHIGDSRVYLFRDGELRQLTADHSLVAEEVRAGRLAQDAAKTDPRRNVVTRAVGGLPARPDLIDVELERDDLLLLCSDGLSGVVDDAAVAVALQRWRRSVGRAAELLVEMAFEAGTQDNVTVVLVRVLHRQVQNG